MHTRRKSLVKEIDECLKLEAVKQMKKELELLQAKVVANIEKELKAASDKGEEERGAVIAGANELIACIYADAKRLHVKSANVVGRAEEMCTALEAKAKADNFSSVNKYIVERTMPEGWAMPKGPDRDAVYRAQKEANWQGVHFVEVPASVKKLDGRVFKGCTALRVVELHDSVTIIGEVRSTLIHNLNRASLNY